MTAETSLRWLRDWATTIRYGSRFTRAGRALRKNMRAPISEYVEVGRPLATPPKPGDA